MKKINKILVVTTLVVAFVFGFNQPTVILAATTPSLGTAGTYGVLSSTFTRNVGVTAIIGNLGYTTLSGSGTHTVSGSTLAFCFTGGLFVKPPAAAFSSDIRA